MSRAARTARSAMGVCLVGGAVASTFGMMATVSSARSEDVPPEQVAEALRIVSGPWTPSAARYDGARDVATATAIALPPDPDDPAEGLAMRRLRSAARAAALERVHDFVDDALAARLASPWVAQRTHDAVDEHARIGAERTFVDGGAAVEVVVPGDALRAAAELRGVPWATGSGA